MDLTEPDPLITQRLITLYNRHMFLRKVPPTEILALSFMHASPSISPMFQRFHEPDPSGLQFLNIHPDKGVPSYHPHPASPIRGI